MSALNANVDGVNNTAVGYSSLLNNQSGTANTAIGTYSLKSNTIGGANTALGMSALSANIDGANNTAVGYSSLLNNQSGIANTAIGTYSLQFNIVGGGNTAIGMSSLNNNIYGINNTALGYSALLQNVSGNNNTALGYEAGHFSVGSGNVFIGQRAGYNEVGDNKLYISNSGTTAPLIYGDFSSGYLKLGNMEGSNIEINSGINGSSGLSFTKINAATSPSSGAPLGIDNNGNLVVIGLTSVPSDVNKVNYSDTSSALLASTYKAGFLKSVDWNTFNNKQNALSNPLTGTGNLQLGYLTRATGNGTIDTANLYWNNGKLGIGNNSPSAKVDISGSIKATNYVATMPATITASSTTTIDLSTGSFFNVTLSANITTLNLINGQVGTYYIVFTQDAIGGRTVSFPASFKWSGGLVPTITPTANKEDVVTLIYNGTTFRAVVAQNF
jgi:hypothetical protein